MEESMITSRNKYFAIIVLCLLLPIVGCTATKIQITADGQPLPENWVLLTNPDTGVEVTLAFVRVFFHKEGEEKILWPDYLAADMPQIVERWNTERLELHITVYNPRKVAYQIWESYELSYENAIFPTYMQKCFYQGSLSVNKYVARLPLDDLSKVTARILVKNKAGESFMEMGPVNYEPVWRR